MKKLLYVDVSTMTRHQRRECMREVHRAVSSDLQAASGVLGTLARWRAITKPGPTPRWVNRLAFLLSILINPYCPLFY